MKSRRSVRLSILLLSLISGISIFSLPASANPMASDIFTELSLWALMMLAANFPVNLFWYLLALRIDAKKWGMKMGDFPRDTGTFASLVLFAVFMITLVGAVIDLIFIIPSFNSYSGVNFSAIGFGVFLIFASVFFASMTVLRMKFHPSLVAGAVLAAMNPLFWGFIRMSGWNQLSLLIPVLFLMMSVVALYLLNSWHRKANSEIPIGDSEQIQDNEKGHRRRVRRDVVISIIILLIIFLPIIMNALTPPPHYHMTPAIGTSKSSTVQDWTWTVVAVGSATILKEEVFIQLINISRIYTIQTERLSVASGTHGFRYEPASAGSYIYVGDIFKLSKNYAIGCRINLVTESATGQYCVLTV